MHIPKCAGTSIEKAFIPVLTGRSDFRELSERERSKHWLPGRRGLQHCKLRWYHRHFDLAEYFKFAFVRNPWDRAVSQITYLSAKTGTAVFSGKSFKENVRIYCNCKRKVWGHDLAACQSDYLRDSSGHVNIDFIGRFESLDQDFKVVCRLAGVEPVPELPHVFNSMRASHYSEFFDEESAEWIRRRFEPDIAEFKYAFERKPLKTLAPADK